MRIALGIEYDGSRFHGWQLQRAGVRTVQGAVELALEKVAAHPVRVSCSGRTDTGVHALQQVVHFDTASVRQPRNWILGANVHLPDDVSVRWAMPVAEEFHARFAAMARSYQYLVLNRATRPALRARQVTWVHRPLNEQRMHMALQQLLGTHDFSSYRAQGCQAKSPIRTLHEAEVRRCGDIVAVRVRANAFLHHMVRNIAGVLIAIGVGDQPVSWAGDILQLRNRALGGVTAPPDGLHFLAAEYPEEFGIPVVDPRELLSCDWRE